MAHFYDKKRKYIPVDKDKLQLYCVYNSIFLLHLPLKTAIAIFLIIQYNIDLYILSLLLSFIWISKGALTSVNSKCTFCYISYRFRKG